jgi:signal transduction histidine kinase
MRSGLLRWLIGAVFMSLAWCCTLVQGQTLDLGETASKIVPGAELAVLVDPTASFAFKTALQHSGWLQAQPWMLNQGSTEAALWMRLRVVNHSREDVTRWLVLGNPRLEHVTYFRLDAWGTTERETLSGGVAHRRVDPVVRGNEAIFAVMLAPGEEALLLIRVQGRTVLIMAPELWDPLAYREHESRLNMVQLAPLAGVTTVAVYLLVISVVRRDRLTFLLAVWLLLGAAYDFAFQGHLRRYLMPAGGDFVARAPHLLALLANLVMVVFIYFFREKCLHRLWCLTYQATALVLLAFSLSTAFGELRWSIGWSMVVLTCTYVIWPLSMMPAWRTQAPSVRAFMMAIVLTCVFGVMRTATFLGGSSLSVIESMFASEFYRLSLVFFLLLGVVRQSVEQSHALQTAQNTHLAAGRQQQLRLEEAVRLRSQALHQAAADADRASLNKNELLTRVGHDLRAPLTAIMGYAQIISGASGGAAVHARSIERNSRQLMVLINELINFARGGIRPDALRLQSIYSNDFLQNIVAHAARLARKNNNTFDFQVSGHLPPVIEIDAKRLRQVLKNLLSNAANFTHQGHIELQMEIVAQTEGRDEAPLSVTFSVRDTGPGIPEEKLSSIFHPFQRLSLSETPQGMGLGLAVVHRWVRRMGGRISVSSMVKQGTTMKVVVPIRVGQEDSIGLRHLSFKETWLPDLHGSGQMIWVVDDSRDIRDMLCIDLVNQGFSVVSLANGLEVKSLIALNGVKRPDLILTDLNMPQSDGWDVLQAVRIRWQDVPVLLMTATVESVNGKGHAFSAVMPKPISLAALRRNIGLLLGLDMASARWCSAEL